MCETEREREETKSARCEQALTGFPTATWDQLAFVMTNFHPITSLYVLNTDFITLAIWFIFY